MPDPKPNRLAIDAPAIGLLAALTAGAWFIGVQPALKARAERETLNAQADTRLAELTLAQHEQRLLAESLAEARRVLENVTVQLVPSRRMNERVAGLTNLARENGLQLDEIKPGATTREELFDLVEIRLSGQASYPASAAFFNALHTNYPDTEVASFRLVARGAGELPADSFQFTLLWYAAPADAAE
ncbi:MAG: hypothetical protein DYG93_03905 [Leptolyngbya sp. PLA2]|nr:hypothetical protein [Leptolyngbya sp.]MCE7970798.1 hypothetical protein [Leptolyngbya sp. PL-A2]MCQ3939953.1 hypothetical protein [cyanobacterium CYA1]MCZ7633580.1 hypothetical protein [Phycisphaerales bacterium]MDL1903302.1 hypothetical protein [Synechococcales cyanobacterium CNB]GIK17996.1 MAG: hypothetical protein BroJett004_01600 [Planctomycetota bacterium]